MYSILAILALAAGAFAQCEPSSSSNPPPQATGIAIHPNGDNSKCVDVQGANFANGTPVQIYDCNGTGAQKWVFARGTGAVRVAGTNYCLDAGSSPGNGGKLKIWQCYAGLAQQTWNYASDNSFALSSSQSMDLTNGDKSNGNQLQTWVRVVGNTNQIWTSTTPAKRDNRYQGA